MAASKTRSTRLPNDLADVAAARAKVLGYPDWNSYIKALIRYDALVQGEHVITLTWAKLPVIEQDGIDAHLLELTKQGKGERGSLLKRMLDKLAETGKDLKDILLSM
jgi:hypothetical protein